MADHAERDPAAVPPATAERLARNRRHAALESRTAVRLENSRRDALNRRERLAIQAKAIDRLADRRVKAPPSPAVVQLADGDDDDFLALANRDNAPAPGQAAAPAAAGQQQANGAAAAPQAEIAAEPADPQRAAAPREDPAAAPAPGPAAGGAAAAAVADQAQQAPAPQAPPAAVEVEVGVGAHHTGAAPMRTTGLGGCIALLAHRAGGNACLYHFHTPFAAGADGDPVPDLSGLAAAKQLLDAQVPGATAYHIVLGREWRAGANPAAMRQSVVDAVEAAFPNNRHLDATGYMRARWNAPNLTGF